MKLYNNWLLIGDALGNCYIYDRYSFELVHVFCDLSKQGLCGCLGMIGKFVFVGQANHLVAWDFETKEKVGDIACEDMTFSDLLFFDDSLVVCSDNGRVLVFPNILDNRAFQNPANHRENQFTMTAFMAHEKGVRCLCIAGEYLLTGSYDQTISLWNLRTLIKLGSLVGHDGDVNSIEFYNGNIYSVSGNTN
jgi:WD40 repeat protein